MKVIISRNIDDSMSKYCNKVKEFQTSTKMYGHLSSCVPGSKQNMKWTANCETVRRLALPKILSAKFGKQAFICQSQRKLNGNSFSCCLAKTEIRHTKYKIDINKNQSLSYDTGNLFMHS